MGFLDRLRALFGYPDRHRHDYVESALLFPELDTERMIRSMHLTEEGTRRGSRNDPAPDQDTFDDIENKIVRKIRSEVSPAHEKFTSHMRAYGDRLAALRIGTHLAQLLASASAARTDFMTRVQQGRDLLFQLRRDVIGVTEEFERFREQHRLRRLPNYPSSRTWHRGVLAMLVLVEAVLNGSLLARGLESGRIGGVTQAVIIAIVNVAVGVLAGGIAVRNIVHRQLLRRIVAVAGLLSWIAFVVLFNLTVAHYRAALAGDNPSDAGRLAVQQLLTEPLAIPDIGGWLLFFLGVGFSIGAAFDGWKMDDPYPGYGVLGRRREELSADYLEQKQQSTSQLEIIRNSALSKMNALSGEVEQRAEQHGVIQDNRRQLVAQFKNYLQHLEMCGNELLSAYRHANTASRTLPAPKHFSARWEPPKTGEMLGVNDPPDHAPLQKQLADTIRKLQNARQRIDRDYQAALREFEDIEELHLEGARGDRVHQRPT